MFGIKQFIQDIVCLCLCYSRYRHFITTIIQEEFDDTKGVIIIRKSKKNGQRKCQKKKVQKDKQRSTKHTYKTKDRATRTPLKTGMNSGAPEGYTVPAPLVTSVVLI